MLSSAPIPGQGCLALAWRKALAPYELLVQLRSCSSLRPRAQPFPGVPGSPRKIPGQTWSAFGDSLARENHSATADIHNSRSEMHDLRTGCQR